MTTHKQIAANRRNAQKSTGPKTAAGKARSAQNATKHGLLSRREVLEDEDEAEFKELRINLYEDLAPEGQLETLLVNRIASAQWRLARVPALEAELLDGLRRDPTGADNGLGAAWERDAGPHGGALARLARYETMLERGTVRLLGELRRLQAERRKREARSLALAQAEVDARWRRSAEEAWPATSGDPTPSGASCAGHPAPPGRQRNGEAQTPQRPALADPSPQPERGGALPGARGELAAHGPGAAALLRNEASFLTTPSRLGRGG